MYDPLALESSITHTLGKHSISQPCLQYPHIPLLLFTVEQDPPIHGKVPHLVAPPV